MAEYPHSLSCAGDMQRLLWHLKCLFAETVLGTYCTYHQYRHHHTPHSQLAVSDPAVDRSCTSSVRRSTVSSPRFPGFPLSNRDRKSGPRYDGSPRARSGNTSDLARALTPVMGSKSTTPRRRRLVCNSHLSHRCELASGEVARGALAHKALSTRVTDPKHRAGRAASEDISHIVPRPGCPTSPASSQQTEPETTPPIPPLKTKITNTNIGWTQPPPSFWP